MSDQDLKGRHALALHAENEGDHDRILGQGLGEALRLVIITLYRPDPARWVEWRRRREG